jgi:hypothetical protein
MGVRRKGAGIAKCIREGGQFKGANSNACYLRSLIVLERLGGLIVAKYVLIDTFRFLDWSDFNAEDERSWQLGYGLDFTTSTSEGGTEREIFNQFKYVVQRPQRQTAQLGFARVAEVERVQREWQRSACVCGLPDQHLLMMGIEV